MIRLKTSLSVLDKFLSLNNIRGVMINSQSNFKIIILLKFKIIIMDFYFTYKLDKIIPKTLF